LKQNGRNAEKKTAVSELLAPAGTWEAFRAGLENGADAVYVGLEAFNARALARNFSMEEVSELVCQAHSRGRKLFVAMNSLVKERELPELIRALAGLDAAGVDAVIVQDLGVWRIARKYFPGLRLHASTLMNIHNRLGVVQAWNMGFQRVVLAREMTLEEIGIAVQAAPVEIEVFIHGAMCFTYSGMCLFSSYYGGRSSIRGRCVQPCRRKFTWGRKKGTFFSMNDLEGIEFVHRLKGAGVRSFKIEGRLRPPHYIASVVRAYRMVMDAPEDDREALVRARNLLKESLGRPAGRGYFMSPRPVDAVFPELTANTGRFLGRVIRVEGPELLVKSRITPEAGDRLRVLSSKSDQQCSFRCKGIRKAGKPGFFWVRGRTFSRGCRDGFLFRADLARSPLPGVNTRGYTRRLDGKGLRKLMEQSRRTAGNVIQKIADSSMRTGKGRRSGSSRGRAGGRGSVENRATWIKVDDLKLINKVTAPWIQGVIVEISRKTLNQAKGRKMKGLGSWKNVIWSLPAIIPEPDTGFYEKAVRQLIRGGAGKFQIASLGQAALFRRAAARGGPRRGRLVLYGSYSLNLLNSQAVLAAVDIGVDVPQLSVESDRANAERVVCALEGIHVGYTVYGYLPVFTTRMNHPDYQAGRHVVSPRGEKFFWRRSGGIGRLFPEKPYSVLNRRADLVKTGFSEWIVDLTNRPGSERLPAKIFTNSGAMGSLLKGRNFNFRRRLE